MRVTPPRQPGRSQRLQQGVTGVAVHRHARDQGPVKAVAAGHVVGVDAVLAGAGAVAGHDLVADAPQYGTRPFTR